MLLSMQGPPQKGRKSENTILFEIPLCSQSRTDPNILNRRFSERCWAGSWLLHTSAPCPDQRMQQAFPALSLARQPLHCFSSNSQWLWEWNSDTLNISKQIAEQNLKTHPEAMLIRAGQLNRDRLAEGNSLSHTTTLKKQKEPVDRRVVASRNPQRKP